MVKVYSIHFIAHCKTMLILCVYYSLYIYSSIFKVIVRNSVIWVLKIVLNRLSLTRQLKSLTGCHTMVTYNNNEYKSLMTTIYQADTTSGTVRDHAKNGIVHSV